MDLKEDNDKLYVADTKLASLFKELWLLPREIVDFQCICFFSADSGEIMTKIMCEIYFSLVGRIERIKREAMNEIDSVNQLELSFTLDSYRKLSVEGFNDIIKTAEKMKKEVEDNYTPPKDVEYISIIIEE